MNRCGLKSVFMMILIASISTASSELLRPPQPPQINYAFTKFRPPPAPEPTFIQRITSWIFPWGGVRNEEELRLPASPKIDNQQATHYGPPPQYGQPPQQYHPTQQYGPQTLQNGHFQPTRMNQAPIRDTEPMTARTTPSPPITKCSPCNKVPWIPMMPTYQMPIVKPSGQQQHQDQQVYFKHHFENQAQFAQVPAEKYGSVGSTYSPPTPPIKLQGDIIVGQQYYGTPPVQPPKQVNQFTGYQFPPQSNFAPPSTFRSNTNTIDNSAVTFTTQRPQQNNRLLRITAASTVTNSEYLPPPNILPLEGENSQFKPIPIPNLSPSPIPPLFDARPFHDDPYRNQKTGTIKLVPLEPVAQLSNNVNVQVKPERNQQRFEADNESPAVEVISSNQVAEFTLPAQYTRSETTTPRPESKQGGFRLNVDLGNNLDVNATLQSAIVVESLESVTDTVVAGSEHNYDRNVHEAVEAPLDQIVSIDDDIDTKESGRVVTPRDTFESDEETTTGRYIIKFEPSLQTAADLGLKPAKKPEITKKSRPTPLEMLDSPILHATPFVARTKLTTTAPKTTTPMFKPMQDYTKYLSTLWTSPPPISTSTDPTPTTIYATTPKISTEASTSVSTINPTVQSTASTISYLSKLSSGVFSGITLPKEQPPVKTATSTKKPKQIQIVIPYTTFNKPSPFKIASEQEQITYRSIRGHYVTHPSRKNKTDVKSTLENLVKIENLIKIEKNDRQEKKNLKPEESINSHGYHNDQEYLDHAQESKIVESKVTAAPAITTKYFTKILANNIRDLLKREKSPKPRIDLIKLQRNIDGWTEQSFSGKASTNSLMGHTKSIPTSFLSTKMMKSTTVMLATTTLSPKTTFDPDLMEEARLQYDSILYKKNDDDSLYVKRHDRFLNRDNELVLINNNLTYNSFHEGGVKVFAPKTTLSPRELWKRLHVTISPLTNEKIYVVTPQPRDSANDQKTSTFRPRFSVRPTVATKKQPKKLKPEASRRLDDEETEVEMVDGHSQLLRIITPQKEAVTSSMEVTSERHRS